MCAVWLVLSTSSVPARLWLITAVKWLALRCMHATHALSLSCVAGPLGPLCASPAVSVLQDAKTCESVRAIRASVECVLSVVWATGLASVSAAEGVLTDRVPKPCPDGALGGSPKMKFH